MRFMQLVFMEKEVQGCGKSKVMDQIDIIQGTLAKSFGVIGGYITGKIY